MLRWRALAAASAVASAVASSSGCGAGRASPAAVHVPCGAPDECFKLGDALYARGEHPEALGAWKQACAGAHGESCGRLMEVHHRDSKRSDALAARACDLGHAGGCTVLASQDLLLALRNKSKERARRATERLSQACDRSSYKSCERAAWIERELLEDFERAAVFLSLAFSVGERECLSQTSSGACSFLLRLSGHLRDEERERRYAGAACWEEQSWPDDMPRPACDRARELGVPIEAAAASEPTDSDSDSDSGRSQHSPPQVVEARRTAGVTQIAPGDQDRLRLQRAGLSQVATSWALCISRHGFVSSLWLVTASPLPEWDQRQLEEMRRWRYRPFLKDGDPVPVCTTVTFIYTQR
jgi:hypothetical protein